MDNYLEFSYQIEPFDPWADVLSQRLGEIGFESFVQEEERLKAYIPEPVFDNESHRDIIEEFRLHCTIEWSRTSIEQINWNAEWERQFKPVHIGPGCRIRAPFHDPDPTVAYDILIAPKMAFGTGHHATTHLMMEALARQDVHDLTVLDMGCGTGVLAIFSEILGAKHVLAVDIDDWAVTNSEENIALNSCDRIDVDKMRNGLLDDKSFNLILANINRNVLIENMAEYSTSLATQGTLLLSGFYEVDVDAVTASATSNGLIFIDQAKRDGWALLSFQKQA